jgi:phosphatidylglycerophosphate synthase
MPPVFGIANSITAVRAVLAVLVAMAIVRPPAPPVAWFVVGAAVAATVLDGVDGWAARRFRQSSAFGARFDMEVDALLIMVLSALAWAWGKAGAWVILSGLLRYLFVAAGWIWPWMSRPLEPKRRRQTVCVIQIVALIVVVSPIATPPFSALAAAVALAVLAWSFAVDAAWLYGRKQVA